MDYFVYQWRVGGYQQFNQRTLIRLNFLFLVGRGGGLDPLLTPPSPQICTWMHILIFVVLKGQVEVFTVKKKKHFKNGFFFTILITCFVIKATKLITKVIKTKEIYNMYLLVRLGLDRRGNVIYTHCQPHCYKGENPGLTQSKKEDPQSIYRIYVRKTFFQINSRKLDRICAVIFANCYSRFFVPLRSP